MEDKKFAILIDADNIGSQYIKVIIDEAAKEGIITYKRIYGDWTKPNLSSWKEVLLEYSINPMQQYAYTTGKNSTDSKDSLLNYYYELPKLPKIRIEYEPVSITKKY